MFKIELKAGELTLEDLHRVLREPVRLSIHQSAIDAVKKSESAIQKVLSRGSVVYGINTGFGALAKVRIPDEDLETLQKNLVLSHCTGTGKYLDDEIVRLILVLKINALAQGASGIRLETLNALITLLNEQVYPCIPEKGSVGASGDLAPLSHLVAPLLGEGEVRIGGKILPAEQGLRHAKLEILSLAPKEGLALLNGTQVSCALAIYGQLLAQKCFDYGLISGAMSLEAVKGSLAPFRDEIHQLRRQKGQIEVAKKFRALLEGSEILKSHENCEKVQDPYSLRCIPQVMGACKDHIDYAADILTREANAVTDNPLVLDEGENIVSGGNFHAEPVALVADMLAVAIAEMGALSERRIAMLIDGNHSGLPHFLVENAGLNSGFMIAHVTAAALASENKMLSHPASVDSLPTSANQEDHVSMATHAARRLRDMGENTATIIGIEMLAAAQGMEFHRPLKSSKILEETHADIRRVVPKYGEDRYFAPDIEAAKELVLNN